MPVNLRTISNLNTDDYLEDAAYLSALYYSLAHYPDAPIIPYKSQQPTEVKN